LSKKFSLLKVEVFFLYFSYAPEVVSHSSPSPVATAGGVAGSSVDLAPPTVPLDPAQPTTSVQIRLADGTRLVSKFNHTHTVNDIRQFINMYPHTSLHFIKMVVGKDIIIILMFDPCISIIL
jgi:hypothetical protein